MQMTVLMVDLKRMLLQLEGKLVKETGKRTIDYSNRECNVSSIKNGVRYDLRPRDVSIQQAQIFNYLGSVVSADGISDAEIKRRRRTMKDGCQN